MFDSLETYVRSIVAGATSLQENLEALLQKMLLVFKEENQLLVKHRKQIDAAKNYLYLCLVEPIKPVVRNI